MSFKPKHYRPRADKAKLGQPSMATPSPAAPAAPAAILTSHDLKRAHNHRAIPTVTPRGVVGTYTFPAPPGFSKTSAGSAASTSTPGASHVASLGEHGENDSSHVDNDSTHAEYDSSHVDSHTDALMSEYHLKATRQTDKWSTQVIPTLVPIYLHLLRTTQSLTRPPVLTASLCTCGGKVTTLNVLCLYFDCQSYSMLFGLDAHTGLIAALQSRQVTYCRCKPVPNQLLAEGLFPCAPVAPTLAVDLKLLEFARLQFLTMVPNLSGWCEAMELHLFKFVAQVSHIFLCTYLNAELKLR